MSDMDADWDRMLEREALDAGELVRAPEETARSARIIGIVIRLRQIYTPEGVGRWLFSRNGKLGGQIPWTMMVAGRLDEVEGALPPLDQVAT
jgi:hypothetical protein